MYVQFYLKYVHMYRKNNSKRGYKKKFPCTICAFKKPNQDYIERDMIAISSRELILSHIKPDQMKTMKIGVRVELEFFNVGDYSSPQVTTIIHGETLRIDNKKIKFIFRIQNKAKS